MPYAGTVKLSKSKRAKIVAEKHLGIATAENIAAANGVCTETVFRTVRNNPAESLEPDLSEWKARITEQAKLNVSEGLVEMNRRMFDPKAKLSEVTGAVKISHDIVQLQTGGPTSIEQQKANVAGEVVARLIAKFGFSEAEAAEYLELMEAKPVKGLSAAKSAAKSEEVKNP